MKLLELFLAFGALVAMSTILLGLTFALFSR
jgi:hypothetical protein